MAENERSNPHAWMFYDMKPEMSVSFLKSFVHNPFHRHIAQAS
ncbi:hypothetical protein [Verminephrobacter eiseniae]|nr:hypothetical protein [Verminephrobacter eiseniae]